MKKGLSAVLLVVASTVFATLVVEVSLRWTAEENKYFPYYPNTVRFSYPSNQITPGVIGTSRFSTNSFGTRGPEPIGDEEIRILTIGGSTTADTVLDDTETWPNLLSANLVTNSGRRVWVTNSGIDGLHSYHHLMHARYLIPQLPEIDFVIVHVGINDLGLWFHHEEYDPGLMESPINQDSLIGEAFRWSNYTSSDWPVYKKTQIWKLLSRLKNLYLSSRSEETNQRSIVQDSNLQWLQEERARRNSSARVLLPKAKLETLPTALAAYARSLKKIAREIQNHQAVPVFMAQIVQAEFDSEEERNRFWMGELGGGQGYVSEEQYPSLLAQYNGILENVARESGSHFIDLPNLVSRDGRLFYDGMHFNEHGASEVAKVVSEYLIANLL